MRILHVIEMMAPRYGGPVSVVKSLSAAQAAAGNTVTVATTNAQYPTGTLSSAQCQELKINGVTTHFFNVTFNPLKFSWQFHRKIGKLIRQVDIVHVHGFYRYPTTYTASLARRYGVPVIIRPHGNLDPYMHSFSKTNLPLKRLYEKLFDLPNLRNASAIHYTTEDERNQSAHLRLKTASFVLPNGVDLNVYNKLPQKGLFKVAIGLPSEKKLILFLGRIHFKKGLDLLIPAFAEVRHNRPDVHLAIVGPDNDGYGKEIRALVASHSQTQAVTIVDMLTGSEVLQAYIDADVFVLPSYVENFGNTVIEAMACGTPVVVSDQVNIYREVRASGGGVVTTCNVAEIAKVLQSILSDRQSLRRMGECGKAWVHSNLSWETIVRRLDLEYKKYIRS